MEDQRLWDFERKYDEWFTSDYCRKCPKVCPDCPQPRLLPDAVPAALAYLRCRGQWNYAPSGLPTGLRMADCMAIVRTSLDRIGVTRADLPQLMDDLLAIESGYVAAYVDIAKRERAQREPAH